MSALRDFWVYVVPTLPKGKPPKPGSADEATNQQVKAAEEEKKRAQAHAAAEKKKAEAAAYKAKVMKSLADVIGPYKKALADQGPEAQLLLSLMTKIKASLAKGHFAEAAKDLDVLKELLSEPEPESKAKEEPEAKEEKAAKDEPKAKDEKNEEKDEPEAKE